MDIDDRQHGHVRVLRPLGRMSVETFGELKAKVSAVLGEGCRTIVVNLSGVSSVDSIGVAEIVRAHVMLRNRAGRLALSNLSRPVEELLSLTRLDTVLDTYGTESDAVRALAPTG